MKEEKANKAISEGELLNVAGGAITRKIGNDLGPDSYKTQCSNFKSKKDCEKNSYACKWDSDKCEHKTLEG